jgi:hypothetical protein
MEQMIEKKMEIYTFESAVINRTPSKKKAIQTNRNLRKEREEQQQNKSFCLTNK